MCTRARTERRDLTGNDFLIGLVAALRLEDVTTINQPQWVVQQALIDAFHVVRAHAHRDGTRIQFRSVTNLHNSKRASAYTMITEAIFDRMLILRPETDGQDDEFWNLTISYDLVAASVASKDIAPSEEAFRQAARTFIQSMQNNRARHDQALEHRGSSR